MKILKENKMNKESLREIVKIVESTISKKLTESSGNKTKSAIEYIIGEPITKYHGEANNYAYQLPGKSKWFTISRKEVDDVINNHSNSLKSESKITESAIPPFQNKREAIFAIEDVMDGSMTQKNFINQLASARRSGTIDQNNFKLILGQLRMDAKSAGVKLEPIIDRLIDKYHPGSDVFNPNLGESVDGGWKNTFVYRKSDKKKFKVIDFKNYGSYQELFLKSDDGETDEVTLGHPLNKKGFMQTYTVNESKKLNENPLAPTAAPTKPAAPAPAAAPTAPVEQGVDPAWKLDMIDFIGNSFQGQAKQFLYQAKKSNPKATPEQITAMLNDLIASNQIIELFKTRFLASIKAAL